MRTQTGAELALSLCWVVVAVLRRERVAAFAVCLSSVGTREAIAEKGVLSGVEGQHMCRVLATLVVARVVDLIAVGNLAVVEFVAETVRPDALVANLKLTIASVRACLPGPALARAFTLDVLPIALLGRQIADQAHEIELTPHRRLQELHVLLNASVVRIGSGWCY